MPSILVLALSMLVTLCGQARAQSAPRVCDVKSFGAKGDGVTKDTAALQAAIDACAGTGGSVRLHDGVFLSGMITLRSDLHFVIEKTATLRGTQDDADYPDTHPKTDNSQLSNCRKALVYAEGATNLVLEGDGTIDGNGNTPKWLGSARAHPERTRPMAVYIVQSSNVTIQNLHVKDAAMWAVVNLETDNLVIRALHVHTPLSGTRDGIDIVDCHHVLIEDCEVYSEDDSICLKSGALRGVEDVTVRNCHVERSIVANGLKLGTASRGSFRNVLFEDVTIDSCDKAALAVESVDGAAVSDIAFRRIRFRDAGAAVFVLLGRRGNPPAVGSIDNVLFEDVTGEATRHAWGSIVSGTVVDGVTYAPRAISFRNVRVKNQGGVKARPAEPPEYDGRYPDPNLWGNVPASGYYLRHVDGVSFDACATQSSAPDARPVIVQRDVRGFESR